MIFFEEYFDYMDDMTPEQYCQFMTLIKDLRFNNKDVHPEEITDKVVRLAWRAVRPSVLKSTTNARGYERRKGEKDTKKKEEEDNNEMERWLSALKDGKLDEHQLFNKYWNRYFEDEESAKVYVVNYLKQYNKHISL